jgi:hypothetical protein
MLLMAVGCGEGTSTMIHDLSTPDLSGVTSNCDLTKQDCTTGMKCTVQLDSQGNVSGTTCVTAGTVAAGQPCMPQQSPDTLLDNCVAGYICDDLLGNFSNLCRKFCTKDAECGSGEKCGDFLLAAAGWGWCASTCTPFSTAAGNCPAGYDCGETADSAEQPSSAETGFFLCKKTGSGGPYTSCMADSDCGANLWCGVANTNTGDTECLPNCSDSVACLMPPSDAGLSAAMCHPLATQPGNAGYCLTR